MRTAPVALLLLLGCSDPERGEAGPSGTAGPGATSVGVVLEGDGPRLQIALTFIGVDAPASHVEPVAAAMVKVRASCFSTGATRASVRAQVRGKRFHVLPGTVRDCLARTLDGATIEDPSEYEVHIEVAP